MDLKGMSETNEMKIYSGENTGAGEQKVTVTRVKCVKEADLGSHESYELPLEPSLKLFNHSPNGFQWGYGGSGPAQLALAILLDLTEDSEYSVGVHQEFKHDLIATAGNKLVITEPEIIEWMKKIA